MATGKVTITQDNNAGGGNTELERRVLFIGVGGTSAISEELHAINQQTDLDAILGYETSELKTNVEAALMNAGSNFTAWVYALGSSKWDQALEAALDAPNDLNVEIVAMTNAITDSAEIDALQASAVSAINTWAKYLSIHVAVPGIAVDQTWSQYLTATTALQSGKVANRVCLVPQLHGNNLGVVIGRLCNDAFSLGDSPMRVRSGSVLGLGSTPVDMNGSALTMAHLETLASARFSVPQTYTGYDGVYWADHMTLDAEGGDFQVYENLRVIDYVTRRVRLQLIQKVADRTLNSSPSSIAYHQTLFMKPVFDAAKSVVINGEPKPGLVQPPVDGDITIVFNSATEVEAWLLAAPINSPKKITAHISLDVQRLA